MTAPVPVFPVPAFGDNQSQIQADFATVPGLDNTLRLGVLPVLILILAKLTSGEYAYLQQLPNRALIPTLMQAPYLDTYSEGVGLERDAASGSSGAVALSGSAGIPIPAGTQMQDSTGAVILQTTALAEIAAGAASVNVPVASVTKGMAANLAANAPVTLLVGIAGINANGVVVAPGLSGGADQEDTSDLQERLAERMGSPPQGGAAPDFVSWAKEITGVTRVWVYGNQYGAGTVAIAFLMDGRVNPVPLSPDIANVQSQVDTEGPVIGQFFVITLAAVEQAVTVAALTIGSGYILSQVQANIATAIAALNYTTTPGGYGWDGQQQNYVTGGTLPVELVSAAIAQAPGVATFDLVAPAADIAVGFGQITQLQAPTFA